MREWTNVETANGFIGLIPVINYSALPRIKKKNIQTKKGCVKGGQRVQSVTRCLH